MVSSAGAFFGGRLHVRHLGLQLALNPDHGLCQPLRADRLEQIVHGRDVEGVHGVGVVGGDKNHQGAVR